ncbi:MAG: response regulator [Bacteroidales bacterium]|nr:response regulator [Bacteroidales bacterium]MBK7628139.1 response regulator [Bacteroidales bacterium]
MKDSIKILFLEDVLADAEMIWTELSRSKVNFSKKLVENKEEYISALKSFEPDLIISDYSLPQFDGMTALLLKNEMAPEVPFILVTGSINEEIAVELMKAGADDYVIKQNLSRLASALNQALKKREIVKEKLKIESELRRSEQIFTAFMDYCPVFFFFKDHEARPIRLSSNYEKMIGRPVNEVIGRSMFEIFPEELAKTMIHDDLTVLKNNVPVSVVEELNGRIYETLKFPIKVHGMPTYLAGFTIDITEQKKSETALKQKIEELEQFNDLTVGRELKMIELKQEVNSLLKKMGQKEKYKIVE